MNPSPPLQAPNPARRSTPLRKVVVALMGGTVVLIGVAMVVLPGPAVVVIPAGLAILATEFVWARRLLDKTKARIARSTRALRRSRQAE